MSARARSIDRAQPAPRTTHTEILCDPCPSFCTPVVIPVRPNDDIRLTASNDVSHFVPCRLRTEVAVRHIECTCRRNRHPVQRTVLDICGPHCFLEGAGVSCVVTATACSRGVVFPRILLGTCCSLVLGRSYLTARGSLFVGPIPLSSGDLHCSRLPSSPSA